MNTTETVGIERIGQIYVRVSDLDKAVEFYRDSLGMRYLFQVPNMAFFDCGGVRLMLGVPESPEFDHPSSIIYYLVSDIQGTYNTFRERGVSFKGEPHVVAKLPDHELWMAFFKDGDENTLALMSEVRE